VRDIHRYLSYVRDQAAERQAGGMGSVEAAFDIDLGEFAGWPDSERIVVTVDTVYRELDPARPDADALELFRQMGRYHRDRVGALRG
jgi:cyclase